MAFKIASVNTIIDRFSKTFLRFPLSILVAASGTALVIIAVDVDGMDVQEDMIRGMLACLIALPALIAVKTFTEANDLPAAVLWSLKLLVLALVAVFYFRFDHLEGYRYPVVFLLLFLATHLMVAFAPWLGGRREGFWAYNKQLFLQILIAFIYSSVLFGGLSIAILAVDQLFNADISEETYLRLFFFIAGVFNTVFFLSGVPKDYEALSMEESYPKGLKIFTQYVLLPLVFIYLLILYAYMAKIFILAEWPVGWVAILVLCFSIAGIFSFLLIYPLRHNPEDKWIGVFNRWFYFALIPLTVLLYVAIFKRLQQYGITEERYFVLLLAIWLTGIIAYFLLSKKDDIRVIPISLFLLTLLAVFTAFPVARISQLNRMELVLEKYGLLQNGKINLGTQKPTHEMEKALSSFLDFLDDREDMDRLQPYLSFDLKTLRNDSVDNNSYSRVRLGADVMSELGMTYRYQWNMQPTAEDSLERFSYYGNYLQVFDIEGYDLMRKQYFSLESSGENDDPSLSFIKNEGFSVIQNGKSIAVDLDGFAKNLAKNRPVDTTNETEEIRLDLENDVLLVRLYFEDIRFDINASGSVENLGGTVWLLVKEK